MAVTGNTQSWLSWGTHNPGREGKHRILAIMGDTESWPVMAVLRKPNPGCHGEHGILAVMGNTESWPVMAVTGNTPSWPVMAVTGNTQSWLLWGTRNPRQSWLSWGTRNLGCHGEQAILAVMGNTQSWLSWGTRCHSWGTCNPGCHGCDGEYKSVDVRWTIPEPLLVKLRTMSCSTAGAVDIIFTFCVVS